MHAMYFCLWKFDELSEKLKNVIHTVHVDVSLLWFIEFSDGLWDVLSAKKAIQLVIQVTLFWAC